MSRTLLPVRSAGIPRRNSFDSESDIPPTIPEWLWYGRGSGLTAGRPNFMSCAPFVLLRYSCLEDLLLVVGRRLFGGAAEHHVAVVEHDCGVAYGPDGPDAVADE